MLNEFPSETLPGDPSVLSPASSDTATFNQLWQIANAVFLKCVQKRRPKAGWSQGGTLSLSMTDRCLMPAINIKMDLANHDSWCQVRSEVLVYSFFGTVEPWIKDWSEIN